jgi:hypothetical protein
MPILGDRWVALLDQPLGSRVRHDQSQISYVNPYLDLQERRAEGESQSP